MHRVNELQDPTYQYKVDIGNFQVSPYFFFFLNFLVLSIYIWSCVLQGMKVFFLVIVVLYILYLIFLVVRACSELKNMPYSGISKSCTSVFDAS